MRYVVDHDLHNHSLVSPCSRDSRQTREAVFAYALTNGYRLVAVTDHLWSDTRELLWPSLQELPQSEHCRCLAGAEVDMDLNGNLLIQEDELEKVDFFILALNHFHLGLVTDHRKIPLSPRDCKAYYMERLNRTFERRDLPFDRMGLAHFTWVGLPDNQLAEVFNAFSDRELRDVFQNVVRLGMGVELNFDPARYDAATLEAILRPYRIAKEEGCGFYCGGDAHHPEDFSRNRAKFETIVNLLELNETDKWRFVVENIR